MNAKVATNWYFEHGKILQNTKVSGATGEIHFRQYIVLLSLA